MTVPFDPESASDDEVLSALSGRTVEYQPDSFLGIPLKPKTIRFPRQPDAHTSIHPNPRCDNEGSRQIHVTLDDGFRAFNLHTITDVR